MSRPKRVGKGLRTDLLLGGIELQAGFFSRTGNCCARGLDDRTRIKCIARFGG